MGVIDDLKLTASSYKEDYDNEEDPQERLFMVGVTIFWTILALAVLIPLAILAWALFKFVFPGLVAAGAVWFFWLRKKK